MRLVFNSTPLIYLTRAGILPLLNELPFEMLTPPGVKKEVVDRGKEKSAKDALMVEKMIQGGTLKIGHITDKEMLKVLSNIPELHSADAEVLALAREVKGIAVVDDLVAREVARTYGIEHGGTVFVIALLVARKLITKEMARGALDDMISLGWRCSAEQYSQMVKMIEKAT